MALTRPKASQINTVITNVSDPIIVLNNGSTTANIDIGLVLNRGSAANVAIVWQESSSQFVLATTSSSGLTNANIAVGSYANLRTGNVSATTATITNLIGNANITVTGSLLPSANITYDLGSPTQRWREGWFSGSTIHIGDESISVDGNGKWTFTTDGAAVELGKNTDFNPPNANVSGNVTATNYLFANGTPLMTVVNTMIDVANTAMKGYADGALLTLTSNAAVQAGEIATLYANAAVQAGSIVTANTAMKGYVDAINSTLISNAGSLSGQIVTANTALKGYVDGQITNLVNGAPATLDTLNELATALGNDANLSVTLASMIGNVNANIGTANTAMKGYVDAINTTLTANLGAVSGSLATLFANAGAQSGSITTLTSNAAVQAGDIATLFDNAGAQSASMASLNTNKANLSGAVFTGAVTTTELFVTSPGGDEGGQISLSPAVTNTTLVGNVTIDVYQNKLRIWEGGGTNRGGYFDLTGLSAGVSTNLAAASTPGGADTQVQFNNSSSFGGAVSLRYFSGNGVVLANATTASTSTTTGVLQVSGGIGVGGNVWCGQVYSTNNGNGTNYRIGDDAWLGDVNLADTTQLMGAQNGNNGYLRFGNVGTETLGRAGSGALTWTGTFSAGNINSDNHNYANGTSIITTLSSAITTANTAMKGYVDGQITTVNSSITTANTAMKGYVDAVTTAWTANAGSQAGDIATLYSNAAVQAGAIATLTSNAAVQAGDIATLYANAGAQSGSIATLTANAAVQAGDIAGKASLSGATFSGTVVPNGDNTINLGGAGARWATVYGVTFSGVSTTAKYADLAEIYTSDKNYVPGTVVSFGGTSEVTVSLTSHDPAVAGVVSTNPAYLMNDREDGSAVALQGRVPCRVLGPVSRGDRVVTSDVRGVAERLDMAKYQPGCIIGKALGSIPDGEIVTIEVVVGRN